MPSRRLLLSTLCALWCAGYACASRQPAPDPPATQVAPSADGAPESPNGKGTDAKELSEAFDPEKRTVDPIDHNVPPPTSVEPDGTTAAKERFAQDFAAAQGRLTGADKSDALHALKELSPEASAAGPEAVQQLLEAEVKVRHANKDAHGAQRAAEKWLKSCGPSHPDACRRKALAAMGAGARERVAAIQKEDACLQAAEGSAREKPPACLAAALKFYERETDGLMVARALLARALNSGDAASVQAFREAERACSQARCMDVRRKALREAAGWALQAEQTREAAALALREMKLGLEALPTDEKLYGRTALVDKVCVALDAKDGAGACRKLEKEVVGRYVFRDFSREPPSGIGLAPDVIQNVNQHYAALLEDCLAQEADRLTPPDAERYRVRWIVLNDGRVDQVHLHRKDQDQGPLAQCLRTQFAHWRYPRYKGEWQHVEQNFLVSARERRSMPSAVR